jgi:PAS domain S-box-containing protein
VLVYSLYYWRTLQPAWKGSSWGIFIVLLVLTPITSLFIGLRFTNSSALPIPGVPSTLSPGSALMLFSAVPWMLAGGFLGPIGAAVVGLLAGALRGAWDSFQFFTALEYALLGVLFSVNVRQNFRTMAYRVVRQPFISALVLIPLHTILYIIGTFLSIKADIPPEARLDFALTSSSVATLSFAGEVLIAGLVAQIIALVAFPAAWGSKGPLQPSPTEKSLEIRFLIGTGTFISLLLLTLLIGDWVVAGRAARQMLEKRLSSTAESAAQNVPFFLETGQNLAVQLASDPRQLEATDPELSSIIGQHIQMVPYFDQLFIVDAQSADLLAGYPERKGFALYAEERTGLTLASSGVLTQIYSIPPLQANGLARASFMVAVRDGSGQVRRVLIGRTTLETNPLTQPLITSLKSIEDLHGTGILLDENGRIIYHYSESGQAPASFDVEPSKDARFFNDTASDGTRQLVYYQPVRGRPWAVVFTVPAQQVQQLALNIAMPLSIMIILLALLALISLRVGLRVVTRSLQTLAVEADRIAQGKLDHPLQVEGVDEVGQLRRAFEQMRASLQSRLEELNRLLHVSQRVASSLEMQDAVQPVLEAIQSIGASSVRVVLSPSILPDTPIELPSRFASSPAGDVYAHLDDQILALARKHEQTVIPNMTRTREFVLDQNQTQPQALLAVALRHEKRYYGVVWAGFDQPHAFTESDIRFVTTLAGQAALAVANARLFLNVEAARRQLEAILNSTPDPVLVTDSRNRLLLANRAANQALGTPAHQDEHSSTEKIVKQRALLDLLQSSSQEKQSAEIVLPDGRTYFATASSVVVEGHSIGRVCILRDITHFKELDTMKSDFVATVSHDLRSPLTLMRGYATMLEMVGEINEQQQGYVKKIIIGVENMSRLVNNLLDLGRIEVGVGLQVENVSVLDILERVTSTLQLQATQKNISLNVELPKDMPNVIQADQALLHQAVYNLVENALKYTPEGGSVTVNASTMDNSLIFSIADNGIGVSPDDLPRLFEKFYRGSQREARTQHGTGLGLAIVRSIAERHGGKVWVDSKLGKGSMFYLQIPLTQKKEA